MTRPTNIPPLNKGKTKSHRRDMGLEAIYSRRAVWSTPPRTAEGVVQCQVKPVVAAVEGIPPRLWIHNCECIHIYMEA